jgi:hypothetical protein
MGHSHYTSLNRGEGETLIESPAHFDDIGYTSDTCPRPEVRATVEAP